MERSEQIDALAKSLVAAQKEIDTAHKTSDNPFFKSKYADLTAVIAAVKGPLNKHGIAFLQAVSVGPVVETILLHETGQFISTQTPVEVKKESNAQELGSGITYSKRYALQAICGLPTDDDDGNAASKPAKTKTPAKKPQQSPPVRPPESKAVLDKVCKYLTDSVPEGLQLLADAPTIIGQMYYTKHQSYPIDIAKASEIASKIIEHKSWGKICEAAK